MAGRGLRPFPKFGENLVTKGFGRNYFNANPLIVKRSRLNNSRTLGAALFVRHIHVAAGLRGCDPLIVLIADIHPAGGSANNPPRDGKRPNKSRETKGVVAKRLKEIMSETVNTRWRRSLSC